ncbi:MAG: biopolymer transporter ExbD [Saprospiraceae bacterium]|nr:biopolymer transporter ExbD [Saprospiraceae bacterium]
MAGFPDSSNGTSRTTPGNIRSKKRSTRVDLTPMVDLAFLLITFFMLATTLAKPHVMALVMPDNERDASIELPQSKVLTILLGADNKVYWYEGIENAALDSTDYSASGLRQVILGKMKRVQAKWGSDTYTNVKSLEEKTGSHLNVIIKPTRASSFQNLVDALDKMAVCRVRYYVLLDVSPQEEAFIAAPSEGLRFTTKQQLEAALR